MASKERIVSFQSSGSGSSTALPTKVSGAPKRDSASILPIRAWKARPTFARATNVEPPLAPNPFPVVETPKYIFSAQSLFRTEKEIVDACGSAGPLPFSLKGSTLYTLLPPTQNSVFAPALRADSVPCQDKFAAWLCDAKKSRWAIELLNRFLRLHAWKRGMRFDECHSLFYFTRSKPKKLWWETGGKIAQREVTAPHMKYYRIENQDEVEFQCGWKHEAVRAGFVLTGDRLFLQLDPAWFLTELDGKTPASSQPVEPLDSSRSNESGAEFQRTLRFWSAVFTKGHRELRMETGTGPIRVKLTTPTDSSARIISKDSTDIDYLALTDMLDDGRIPELGPVEV